MSAFNRPRVGESQRCMGRTITAHVMQPDVLIRINDNDYGIYLSKQSGFRAAMRHIDELEAKEGAA
jgi:hypothetical protein